MKGNKNSEAMPETFTELAEMYVNETPLRPATIYVYLSVAKRFDHDMKMPCLEAIGRHTLKDWRQQVLSRARPATWNNYFSHWRAVWRWGLARDLVTCDPLAGGKWSLRSTAGRPKTVSRTLITKALNLIENNELCEPGWFWAKVLRFFYFTGIRRRQLVSLRWRDVELASRRLKLSIEGSKTHREWDISLRIECVQDITELHQQIRRVLNRPPLPYEQIFNVTLFNDRYAGQIMTEQQVSGFFRRLSEHLGKPISAHRLRHTLATDLTNIPRASLKTVQEILGHTDIRTTLIYVHPDLEAQQTLLSELAPLTISGGRTTKA